MWRQKAGYTIQQNNQQQQGDQIFFKATIWGMVKYSLHIFEPEIHPSAKIKVYFYFSTNFLTRTSYVLSAIYSHFFVPFISNFFVKVIVYICW
jgi:hypothetical protein